MKEFKVNECITLKLEEGKTNIYVKGRLFNQCKFLLLNIPIETVSSFDEIESIDEAAEHLNRVIAVKIKIPPETEFWAHCSNLQVWVENKYDTRLIHSNLSFPLLKRLTEIGDPLVRKVFKEEIVKRIESGYVPVIEYLFKEDYITFLSKEEVDTLILSPGSRFIESIFNFKLEIEEIRSYIHKIKILSPSALSECLKRAFTNREYNIIEGLFIIDVLNSIEPHDYISIIENPDVNFLETLFKTIEFSYNTEDVSSYFKSIDKVFIPAIKECIIRSFEQDNLYAIALITQIYLYEFFSQDELVQLLEQPKVKLMKNLIIALSLPHISPYLYRPEYRFNHLSMLIRDLRNNFDEDGFSVIIYDLMKNGTDKILSEIIYENYYKSLNKPDLKNLFSDPNSSLKSNLIELMLNYGEENKEKRINSIEKILVFLLNMKEKIGIENIVLIFYELSKDQKIILIDLFMLLLRRLSRYEDMGYSDRFDMEFKHFTYECLKIVNKLDI